MTVDYHKLDWSKFEHAYGPALEIPADLDAIAAGKRGAVEVLANRIAHQGWASCAVATKVVPYLWALATGAMRAPCALLLANLSCMGDHMHYLASGLDDFDYPGDTSDYDRLREAVVKGAQTALPWLDDKDAKLRSATAVLLAVTRAPGGAQAIAARLGVEKTAVVRFDLLAALGWFRQPETAVLQKSLQSGKALEQAGAAISLARHGRLDDAVVSAISAGATITAKGSAWNEGNVAGHCVTVLLEACRKAGREDLLNRMLAELGEDAREDVGHTLVQTMFAKELEGPEIKDRPLESLSASQRTLLEQLAQFDDGWDAGAEMGYLIRKLGLPPCPPLAKAYLGLGSPAPTLADSKVEVDGRKMSYVDWIVPLCTKGAQNMKELGERLAAMLPAGELIELLERLRERKLPWAWAFNELRMYALVACGDGEAIRARLQRLAIEGEPWWWNERGGRLIDPAWAVILFAAWRRIDPKATAPKGLKFDDRSIESLSSPKWFGKPLTDWVAKAFSRTK